jgi:hypothetical protein
MFGERVHAFQNVLSQNEKVHDFCGAKVRVDQKIETTPCPKIDRSNLKHSAT